MGCGLFEWKQICAGFLSFVYTCTAIGDLIIKKERVKIPLSGLTRPLFVPVPSLDLDFQCHMSWSFICSMIWGKCWLFVILIFDIGEIVDHHCLNFLVFLEILYHYLSYNLRVFCCKTDKKSYFTCLKAAVIDLPEVPLHIFFLLL